MKICIKRINDIDENSINEAMKCYEEILEISNDIRKINKNKLRAELDINGKRDLIAYLLMRSKDIEDHAIQSLSCVVKHL